MEELEFQFFDLLKKHDFWYTYSDDHQAFKKGSAQRIVIGKWLKDHPSLKWVWDSFCRAMEAQKNPMSLEEIRRDY